ncbi:putative cyclin-D6-1 [Morus notabilis]|nr:putative cyclin-D6-1 [Morus notabilis]
MTLKQDYDPYEPLPMLDSEDVGKYFKVEDSYMAAKGYARNKHAKKYRERAVLLISKYSNYEDFDPVIPYLAMNYFDRYISKTPILGLSRNGIHNVDLTALACLVLAWKMRDLNFKTPKFLAERQDLAGVSTLELVNMEIRIMHSLDWRMRSVTAFCYLPYFEPKFHSTYGFSRRTLNEIIIQIQDVIGMVHYKPSVIAASALLSACYYLYPERYQSFFHRITLDDIFQQYRNHIELCVEGMISVCNNLQLIIESKVPEEETSRIRQVQAGWKQEGPSTHSTSMTRLLSTEERNERLQFDFRLRWSIENSNVNAEDFVIFRPLPKDRPVAEKKAEEEPKPQPEPSQVAPQVEVGPNNRTPHSKECCSLL